MKKLKSILAGALVAAACVTSTAAAVVPLKGVSDNDATYWDRAVDAGANSIRFDFATDDHSTFTGSQALSDTYDKVVLAKQKNLEPIVTFLFPTRDVSAFAFSAALYADSLYDAGLRYIEIGNEWNTSTFWDLNGDPNGTSPNPALAAEISYQAAKYIKVSRNDWYGQPTWDTEGHSDYTIISGGTAPGDCVTNTLATDYNNQMPAHQYFYQFRFTSFFDSATLSNKQPFDDGYLDGVGHHPYTTATSGDVSPDPARTTGTYAYDANDARGWQRYMVSTTDTTCANYWNTGTPNFAYPSIRKNLDNWTNDGNNLSALPIWATEFASWSQPTSTWNETDQDGVGADALALWDAYNDSDPSKWGAFFWYAAVDREAGNPPGQFTDEGPGLFRSNSSSDGKPIKTTFYNATL